MRIFWKSAENARVIRRNRLICAVCKKGSELRNISLTGLVYRKLQLITFVNAVRTGNKKRDGKNQNEKDPL